MNKMILVFAQSDGLAMVRGAFCGSLSCPPRDRKQHENRDVFLPTKRHALLDVVELNPYRIALYQRVNILKIDFRITIIIYTNNYLLCEKRNH